ncbi:unnamed protein product [Closterium sp. NIES-53]
MCHFDVATVAAALAVAAAPVAAAVAVAVTAVVAAAAVAAAPVAAAAVVATAAAAATGTATAAASTVGPSFVHPRLWSCFFRDCTDLTPLHTPVTVALADPSVGSVIAHSTTILPCPAAPSGFLTGYYTPSFSRNLVGVSHLHDLGVITTFPLDEPVASCTVGATGVPLATFHREPGSGLYPLHTRSHHTRSGQVTRRSYASAGWYVTVSSQVSLSHLPRFLARLRRRALLASRVGSALPLTPPRSPPTTAPFQTLHLDVWGPSPVRGPREERYFLIVVDDYSRYTTVLPLRRKAGMPTVLELWLLVRGDAQALCGLCLHSDRGGEIFSARLEKFCQGRGIVQSYTLPDLPQQNGVAERRIGLVMEAARTSMCHAGAPQLLWPQAVRYDVHQLNLWPSDARPRVTPVSLWTGFALTEVPRPSPPRCSSPLSPPQWPR